MELSLQNFLNMFPAAGSVKEGDGAFTGDESGAGTESLSSFEQWLNDLGVQDGTGADTALPDIDFSGEFIPNLVVAQGSPASLTPAQILSQLTGVDDVDIASISTLSLSREQAGTLADMMKKYLQRPDVNATLGESQRNMLQQMMAQLQQAGEEGQPVATVLKPLTHTQGVPAAELKERAPLMGQMMKWLRHVLGDAAKPAATANAGAAATTQDAPAKEPARLSFPGIAEHADTALEGESTEETLSAVPVIPVPFTPGEPAEPLTGQAGTNRPLPALADGLAQEADDAIDIALPPAVTKQGAGQDKAIASADFAQIMHAANLHNDAAEQPQLTLKAAAALAETTSLAQGRVLGGSATGEIKMLGMSADKEKALANADQLQAVSAAVETQTDNAATRQPSTGSVTDLPATAGATASGFHVGQSNQHQPSIAMHYANARVPVPEQVQVAVKQVAKEGLDRITLQLQPEELGRIDVRLDMHADGRAQIVFTVDKPETFEQLQRDARFLEKALQDAGVQTDAGSMEFNLRQHAQQEMPDLTGGDRQHANEQAFAADEGGHGDAQINAAADAAENDTETLTRTYSLDVDQGLDIRV